MTHPHPEHFGHYHILRELGEGSMGTVYLAQDTLLDRLVAVKWLKQGSLERLRREAQLQARVEHPAICRLYEVSEHEGCPFLVMQYIEGRPIDQAAASLNLEGQLRLMATLADALHAAHQKDLVHRDLKPSNLLAEMDEAGHWRPFILDFGLARDLEASIESQAGTLVGSPAYMAPEQIEGTWVDRRADVYALGATFFEVFTGRPPFLGNTTLEVLAQVRTQEAPLLRSLVPDLPADLEIILQTCLAKDPAQRYPSAAALRDDLQRLVDGEPIQARRPSMLLRGLRWMKRNRLASIAAAALLISLLVMGGVRFRLHQKAQAQAYWSQRFGQEVIQMDGILRFGRMLPAHDLTREFEQVRQRMEIIRAQMVLNRDSQGPGHFALGEGYLILGKTTAARAELETTWNGGYRSAEVSLALGHCFIELYIDAFRESLTIMDRQERKQRQADIHKELLEPSITHLKRVRKELGRLPHMEEILLAAAEDRYDDAIALAQTLHRAEPWRVEALLSTARVSFLQGTRARNAGQMERARTLLETALDILEQLRSTNRSDDRLYMLEGEIWSFGKWLSLKGADIKLSLEHVVEANEHALAMNPQRLDLLVDQALALIISGDQANQRGEDPEPWYQRAERVNRKILEFPSSQATPGARVEAYGNLADIAWSRAIQAMNRKQDIRTIVEKGLEFIRLAKQTGPATRPIYGTAAGLHSTLALHQQIHGEDNLDARERCAEAMRKAAELEPWPLVIGNFVTSLNALAECKVEHGENPEPVLKEAQEALRRSMELAPDLPITHCIAGDTAVVEAQWLQRQKRDAQSALTRALAAYKKAEDLHDKERPMNSWVEPMYLAGFIRLHIISAKEHRARHEDCAPDVHMALNYGRKALAAKPENPAEIRQIMAEARKLLRRE